MSTDATLSTQNQLPTRLATVAFTAVVVLSLVVLFVPRAPAGPPIPEFDKLVHSGLFLLLAATTRWRFGPRLTLLALVIAYAALSEVVQAELLPMRSGDVLDALADTGGALLGWPLVSRLLRRS